MLGQGIKHPASSAGNSNGNELGLKLGHGRAVSDYPLFTTHHLLPTSNYNTVL